MPTSRVRATLHVFLFTLSVTFAAGVPALAAISRVGHEVRIDAGETVHDDLYAGAGEVRIEGTVDGDVVVTGGNIVLTGIVTGDVLAAGGSIDIAGPVLGAVRVAGGRIRVGADISRDLVAAGGRITVERGVHVRRDAWLAGGMASIDGRIGDDLRAMTRGMSLGDSAVVFGDLVMRASTDLERAPGAKVRGQEIRFGRERRHGILWAIAGRVIRWMRGIVAGLMLGGLLLWLFPAFTRKAAESASGATAQSLGVGLLACLLVPAVASVLFLIGILAGGWWLGPLLMALLAAAAASGAVAVAIATGRRLGAGGTISALLIGLAVINLLEVVPILGLLVVIAVAIVGVGAVVRSLPRSESPAVRPAA